jgi:hypothetical protein
MSAAQPQVQMRVRHGNPVKRVQERQGTPRNQLAAGRPDADRTLVGLILGRGAGAVCIHEPNVAVVFVLSAQPGDAMFPPDRYAAVVGRTKSARALVVGQRTYRWTTTHSHRADDSGGTPSFHDCTEHVTVRRDGARGRLEFVFAAGPDHLVSDGILHAGAVVRGDDYLNLNQPGVVRALLDEALSRGWRPTAAGRTEFDGWDLFDAVLARLPAASSDRRTDLPSR